LRIVRILAVLTYLHNSFCIIDLEIIYEISMREFDELVLDLQYGVSIYIMFVINRFLDMKRN